MERYAGMAERRVHSFRLRAATLIAAALSVWLSVEVRVGAAPISPRIVNPANGHTYLLLAAATWKESEAEAVALGGHLATIRNQAEQNWVFKTFGKYDDQQRLLWIGLSDIEKKFHFSWSSGESVSFTCWADEEPNNALKGEDFVAVYYPGHDQQGKWNDWHERDVDPMGLPICGVVEIIPPEGTTSNNATEPQTVEVRPSLTVTNHCSTIRLAWPASASNYLLEGTTDLSKPFTLFGYSETTNPHLGEVSVEVANPTRPMYFRLRKANP
jgi:hypothetical protein